MFSRVRALTGVLSLTGANAEKATEIFDSMKDSTEDLNRAFEELVTRPMQKFRMALAQVQVGSVKLGDVLMVYVLPAVTKIAEFIGVLVEGFKTLEPGIRKTILGFAAFAMLAGPLIFGLGVIATILGSISVVTISVAAGFAALSIGAVMYWDEIKTGAIALWQALKPLFTYLADHVKAQFQKIKDFAVDIWPSIVQIGKKVIGIMKVLWDKYGSQVKAVLIVSLTFITEVSSAILTILIGSLKVLILVLNGEFKAAWLAAKATALQANKDMEQSTLNLAQSISWYFWESMREIALAAKWLADTMIDIMRGIANNPLMIGPLKKWVDGYIDYLHGQKKAYGDHAKEIAKIQDQIGQNFSARLNEQVPKVTAAFEEIKAATTTAVLELKAIPEKQPIQFVEWSKKGAASLKGGFGVIKEAAKTEIQGIQQIADENPINLKFLWVDANGNIIEPPGGQEATLP